MNWTIENQEFTIQNISHPLLNTDHLIAAHHSTKKIADMIGADALRHLSVEHLMKITSEDRNMCTACFGGKYPTEIPVNGNKNRLERKLKFRMEEKESKT